MNEMSCYCVGCLQGQMCDSWREERTNRMPERQQEAEKEPEKDTEVLHDVGTFVAALYEKQCYIGKVIDLALEDDLCYKISFLETKKSQFQWPKHRNEIWCQNTDILFTVSEPTPVGKSKRLLKLNAEDRAKLDNL